MTDGVEGSGHPAPGPGALLARERIARGISISDLSGRLKYAPRQLEALEADDYSKLPGATFVRGMMRAYAKQIGIDPGPALAGFDQRHVLEPVTVDLRTRRIPFPDGKKRATRAYLVLSLLVLVAVGFVLVDWHFGAELWSGWSGKDPVIASEPSSAPALPPSTSPEPEHAEGSAADAVQKPPTPAGMALMPGADPLMSMPRREPAARIALEFQRDSWVEITDGQGRTIMSQLNPGGSQQRVEGVPPFSLIIGNAHGVRLLYNDSQVDLRPYVKVEVARLTLE